MIIFHVSRDPSWSKAVHEIEDLGILVLVRVDAPKLPRSRIVINEPVYPRIQDYNEGMILENGMYLLKN